jgi:chemotaxis protein CheD
MPDGHPRMRAGPLGARTVVKIGPGELQVTGRPTEVIATVLGSCVSACIRDPLIGFGGMNHFMLPHSDDGRWSGASAAMRFGNFAMERLINEILKHGGQRRRLEAKLFGGAAIASDPFGIGHRNADFAERYFGIEGIAVLAQDLRGCHARRLIYSPACGRAFVQHIEMSPRAVLEREAAYARRLPQESVGGSIELFD